MCAQNKCVAIPDAGFAPDAIVPDTGAPDVGTADAQAVDVGQAPDALIDDVQVELDAAAPDATEGQDAIAAQDASSAPDAIAPADSGSATGAPGDGGRHDGSVGLHPASGCGCDATGGPSDGPAQTLALSALSGVWLARRRRRPSPECR
jgi:uncharacterized protein (TIGR03382 family)